MKFITKLIKGILPSFALAALLMSQGCTPKVIKVEEVVKTTEVPTKTEPKSPCTQFDQLGGADRGTAESAFVLYKDQLKAGNVAEALPHWRKAYKLAPGSNGRVKSHFDDGGTIYKYLFENTKDETLRKKYVDTIMMVYDKRKECFGDEAYVNGMKAFDYYYSFDKYTTEENIYNLFKSNFDVKGKNADYFVINPFTKVLFDRVVDKKVSVEEGRKYAKLITSAINTGLSSCKGAGCETWAIINDYAPSILESLEGIDGFYDCEYYSEKYYKLFKQYPDSCDIVNLAYSRMLRGNCATNDPKLVEIKKIKTTTCYEAPPEAGCAARGNEDYGDGKYNSAVAAYLECVDEAKDAVSKSKFLLLVAKIYYRDIKNYSKARKYALDAAKLRPTWGEPYLLIGNLYASSGPLCGTGRGWESQVVTWPAIDMWTKARSVDASVTNQANSLINTYRQYMPKKEDIFFRGIKSGDTYLVPCWIQETTLVRTSD